MIRMQIFRRRYFVLVRMQIFVSESERIINRWFVMIRMQICELF